MNSRRSFLKMIPVAMGSILAISGLDFRKSADNSDKISVKMSEDEVRYKLKNSKKNDHITLRPEPPPKSA